MRKTREMAIFYKVSMGGACTEKNPWGLLTEAKILSYEKNPKVTGIQENEIKNSRRVEQCDCWHFGERRQTEGNLRLSRYELFRPDYKKYSS